MSNPNHQFNHRFPSRWQRFWLRLSGPSGLGRVAARIACMGVPPYHARAALASLRARGFVDPDAVLSHSLLELGSHVFIGGNVVITRNRDGGAVRLEDRVQIYGNSFVDTGVGGRISIGADTHIQPGCHIHAYLEEIRIGRKVEIAARCAFYNYDHGMQPGVPIMEQPLTSKGPITVGDGAWLGHGVTILQGVTIGEGAVIAAGAVVVRDVPNYAIAAGVPAKVVGWRPPSESDFNPAPGNPVNSDESVGLPAVSRRKELTPTP